MIKKIFALVVSASVICAGFLFLGITIMGQYSPVLASSPNALVAGSTVQNSSSAVQTAVSVPETMNPGGLKENHEVSATPTSISPSLGASSQPTKVAPVRSASGATPTSGITIAQLLKSPNQYFDQIFTITGIATRLSSDKFLLNDGTGQIMVDVENNLVSGAVISGISLTVIGKLDDTSSQSGVELDAYTITLQNGAVVSNNGMNDDCLDDSNDDPNDNCLDDSNDDPNDDSLDDSNDDPNDDSLDDSDDDTNDDSEDDSDDGEDD